MDGIRVVFFLNQQFITQGMVEDHGSYFCNYIQKKQMYMKRKKIKEKEKKERKKKEGDSRAKQE